MTAQIFPAVTELIPHRQGMLLVDELVDYSETRFQARTTLRADSLMLAKEGSFISYWSIELMAQTVALGIGYGLFLEKKGTPFGYLIAVDTFDWTAEPVLRAGSVLTMTVEREHLMPPLGIFVGQVHVDGVARGTARMKFYLDPERALPI